MKMKMSLVLSALLVGTCAFAVDNPLDFSVPDTLSVGDGAFKSKLVRLGNGRLISTFGDAVGPPVYDLKGDSVRQARDIFVRSCMPSDDENNKQCSLESGWTEAVNVSNTALLSSMSTRWEETDGVLNELPSAFYGDSGKPNIFNSGTFAVISWTDKYCDGGEQRMISYNERGGITLPFSCIYTARANYADVTDVEPTWTPQRITTGIRDAMQDVNKGLSQVVNDVTKGRWIVTWQEDPHGLQIGGADGPGDGASGANVTHGTDIWYTWTYDLGTWGFNKPLSRISNNYTSDGAGGNTSPIYHPDDPTTEIIELERGNTGSSRANAALVVIKGTANPRAVVTYEETKGADRLDSGKFVRYHEFQFSKPPVSQGDYLNGEPGYIISDPAENARRVRFVTQVKPGDNGLKMGIFWRQGNAVEGGPGDIMVRLGFENASETTGSGLRVIDMVPAVDPNADAIDYTAATLLTNTPASNISSNTVPWAPVSEPDAAPTNTLLDTTDLNKYEDARAHRAAIRGSDFYIGYTYARDWAVATYTDQDNYNFWFRRYTSVDKTWTDASNLSKIPREDKLHVKEPRLVGMPGSSPACTSTDPTKQDDEQCQDKDAVLLAWGTETNVYSHIGGSDEGDIVYTISKDKGDTYGEPLVVVPNFEAPYDHDANPDTPDYYPMNRFESQLRSTPAGNVVFSVWNENRNDDGISVSGLSVSDNRTVEPVAPTAL